MPELLYTLLFLVVTTLSIQHVLCEGKGHCRDTNRMCKAWAQAGQCNSNVNFMETNCCHSCRTVCRDKHPRCGDAAKKGLCNHIKILNMCHMSCGMCCNDYSKKCNPDKCAKDWSFAGKMCLQTCRACSSPCRPCTNAQYSEHHKIEGFPIRAEVGVFYRWPLLTVALKEDFKRLKEVVPQPAVYRLQHWSGLYISKLKLCGTYPACTAPSVADQYHVSMRWLASNNEAPEKAGFVDMSNPGEYLIRRSNIEKYNLLHEFFHAWMDIRRRAGLAGDRDSDRKVKRIKAAWQSAVRRGLYRSVKYAGGGTRPGYAVTSEWEYMGELSEAFFARGAYKNDYYPYNRADLRRFDPMGYAAINAIWSPPYPATIALAGTGA